MDERNSYLLGMFFSANCSGSGEIVWSDSVLGTKRLLGQQSTKENRQATNQHKALGECDISEERKASFVWRSRFDCGPSQSVDYMWMSIYLFLLMTTCTAQRMEYFLSGCQKMVPTHATCALTKLLLRIEVRFSRYTNSGRHRGEGL